MKNKSRLMLSVFCIFVLIFIYFQYWNISDVKQDLQADSNSDRGSHANVDISSASSMSVSSKVVFSSATYASSSVSSGFQNSSVARLSYPKVDPNPQMKYFLESMDKGALPKIILPTLQKDNDFDYKNTTPQLLKEKALSGDAMAAYKYADYVRTHIQNFKKMDDGTLIMISAEENSREYVEMRDFYMHALLGGATKAAVVLSHEYLKINAFDPVESLAWRKIAFAVGESEQWDCLRDSTTCFVKDFNNLNTVDSAYPCIERFYQCKPEDFEDATLRAMQYVQSYQFSPENKLRK